MDHELGPEPSDDANRISAISSTLGSTTTAMEEPPEKENHQETLGGLNGNTANHSPTERNFQPGLLDLKRATAMGYPTEQMLSKSSNNSSEDLEKGVVAPVLVQQELGAYNVEKSDAMPPRRVPHTSTPSYNSTWRLSVPPNEMPKLPYKRERRICRRMRHNLLAVYQRLFSIVFIANMIAFIIILVAYRNAYPSGPPLSNVATAAAANILVGF